MAVCRGQERMAGEWSLSSCLEERNKKEKSKKRLVIGWFASVLKLEVS